MDLSRFQDNAPGQLVEIGAGEHAFIPEPLPPKWSLPATMWPLLLEAREQLALLEGVLRNLEEPMLLLRPLQQRESLRSSSLEGTHASPRELLLFDLGPREATSAADPVNAWREVHNHQRALEWATAVERPLSLHLIRSLHEMLLKGVRGRDRQPGSFRTDQVFIGHDRRFVPPPVTHLAQCLADLETGFEEVGDLDPLIACYVVHYQFETIHPFFDGNGRVGRLLLALMIQRASKLSRPWLYMSAFFDRYKDEYIDGLLAVSTRAAWSEWIAFCLQGTIAQARDTVERCEALRSLQRSYNERVVATQGNIRLQRIVTDLFARPAVEISGLAKELGVTYPTAANDLRRLAEIGILEEVAGHRPKTFIAPEIVRVAFGDPA